MSGISNNNDAVINQQNILYYDKIAADYDAILHKDPTNADARKKVADKFTALVKTGRVLDFGGGTGQDLGWLVQHHYDIVFCEPSTVMRQIALERNNKEFPGARIFFIDHDKTDFRNWDKVFPFEPKADAVLANFAVINCIPDIDLLFTKLAAMINPGGIILALILDNSLTKRLQSNRKDTIKSFFNGNPVKIEIENKDQRQVVYIHTMNAIKKASSDNFKFKQAERLQGSGFTLIHLVRQ